MRPSPQSVFLSGVFGLLIVNPLVALSSGLPLVPSARQVSIRRGFTQLAPAWVVCAVDDRPESVGVDGLIEDVRAAHAWTWTIDRARTNGPRVVVRARPPFGDGMPLEESQGYELRIGPDSIVVAAPAPVGRFYGIQTLRQLVRGYPSGALPHLTIRDYPDLAWRGVSDDISRGQASTLTDFRATLEHLSFYKINLYCLYLEDMARFWSAPEVGADRGALTPSELKLIVQEARRYHITVMPIFQTLGHQERLLAQPAFRRYAERQQPATVVTWLNKAIWTLLPAMAQACGISDPNDKLPASTCFSPVDPQTRKRVMELMDEIAGSVPSPFFHLGGDEPADLGTGTSREAIAHKGLGAVYAEYMSVLADHIERVQHRQPVIFSDVLLKEPAALAAMPKSVAAMDWHYDASDTGASLLRLRQAGFQTVFASPGLWNWFAIYPDYNRAFPNIAQLASAAQNHGASGLVVASWGDGGAESLRRANWAGYAYAADASWRTPSTREEFFDRFVACEFGTPSHDLARAEQLIGWQSFPTLGFNQRLFHWKPRLRTHNADWLERMVALDRDVTEARRLLANAEPAVRFSRASLDVLDHAAARFQYAARRELTMESVAQSLGGKPWSASSEEQGQASLSALGALRDSSVELGQRYSELWLRDNRQPMLGPLLSRLRQQTSAIESMMDQARAGTLRAEAAAGPVAIPKERGAYASGE